MKSKKTNTQSRTAGSISLAEIYKNICRKRFIRKKVMYTK